MNEPFGILASLVTLLWLLALVDHARAEQRSVPDAHRRRRAVRRISEINPPARYFGYGILPLAAPLLLDVWLGVESPFRWPLDLRPLIGLALLGHICTKIVWDRRWRRQFVDHLRRSDHLVCPNCRYSLAGHAHGGACPECAYAFTPESLRDDWHDVERLLPWRGA